MTHYGMFTKTGNAIVAQIVADAVGRRTEAEAQAVAAADLRILAKKRWYMEATDTVVREAVYISIQDTFAN